MGLEPAAGNRNGLVVNEALRLLVGLGAAAADPILLGLAIVTGATRRAWLAALLWGVAGGVIYSLAVAAIFDQWGHPSAGRILPVRALAFALVVLAAHGARRLFRKRPA